jgi:hypothetical protein
MRVWTGCVAGAHTGAEFERALSDAGLVDGELRETHRVHEHASSAIIGARKPGDDDAQLSQAASSSSASGLT